jgi:hypothetical protein
MGDDRGCDRDERLDQVIAGILDEAGAADAVDRRRWLVRYPEFFDELSDFFADRDAIEAIAAPLRDIARAADEEWSSDWLAPPDHPENLGRLGEYEVISRLGQGGMGVVLKGFDAALNRYVAIKVLAPQWSSDAGARRRFTREARAAAAVSHPHVITIHAVGEWRGRPYLVMEYVTGASLQQRIEEAGPLELGELLRIGAQAASGLAAAHAQGLIHRDIKPGNIMLENELARVKITDFGLARAVDDTRLTQHGALAGTPPYMAPEQGPRRPARPPRRPVQPGERPVRHGHGPGGVPGRLDPRGHPPGLRRPARPHPGAEPRRPDVARRDRVGRPAWWPIRSTCDSGSWRRWTRAKRPRSGSPSGSSSQRGGFESSSRSGPGPVRSGPGPTREGASR